MMKGHYYLSIGRSAEPTPAENGGVLSPIGQPVRPGKQVIHVTSLPSSATVPLSVTSLFYCFAGTL